jgi:AraC-like DNA-binding protein
MDVPDGGVPLRDLVIQFPPEPLLRAAELLPELAEVLPLLERARHGIEFFGLGERAQQHWQRVKDARGARRFGAFCDFLADLAACTDYRLLSNVQMQSVDDDDSLDQIDAVVNRITEHLAQPFSAAQIAAELGMSESRFSRFFRRATGNTFTDFVNRVRINRACQLLMETDRLITHICFDVGFNNVANFNRRFLEIKGMTPSEFRKQTDSRFGGAALLA